MKYYVLQMLINDVLFSKSFLCMIVQFIVEMHYKVTAAAHHRHKCYYLAGIEVLVNLLGHRAAIPSTFK